MFGGTNMRRLLAISLLLTCAAPAGAKADVGMMPKLVDLYGKLDSNEISKKSGTTSRIASFRFGDGGVIQHTSSTTKPDRPCTYTVSYKSKAIARNHT